MGDRDSRYPDISDILARKAAGRLQSAQRSFAEKLDIIDAMRERIEPLVRARKLREAQRAKQQTKPD
jgi:hypothetical protein